MPNTIIIYPDRIFAYGVATVKEAKRRYPEIAKDRIYAAVRLGDGYLAMWTVDPKGRI